MSRASPYLSSHLRQDEPFCVCREREPQSSRYLLAPLPAPKWPQPYASNPPPKKKQAGLEFPFPLVLFPQTPSCLFACLWGTKTRCDVSSFQAERSLKETLGDCPGMAFWKEGNQMWIIRVMGRILRQLLLLPWVTTIKPQSLSGSHCLTTMAMRTVGLLGPFHRSSDNVDHQGNDKKTIDSILILRVTVARSWTFFF